LNQLIQLCACTLRPHRFWATSTRKKKKKKKKKKIKTKKNQNHFFLNLFSILKNFDDLTRDSTPTSSVANEQRVRSRRAVAFARDVKQLLDTPDRIWAALSSHRFVDAALLYDAAERLHRGLAADQVAKVPLVVAHWKELSQFPSRILSHARDALQHASLPADAVCAVVLLGDRSLAQAFADFLEYRQRALVALLRSAAEQANDDAAGGDDVVASAVADVLASAVALVRETLQHTDQLFIQPQQQGQPPLVYARLATRLPDVKPLVSADLQRTCDAWLTTCARTIAHETPPHLQRVTRLAGLANVLRVVAERVAPTAAWTEACERTVGRSLDLWDLLLAAPLNERARAIVVQTIDAIPLAVLLRNGAAMAAKAPTDESTSGGAMLDALGRGPSALWLAGNGDINKATDDAALLDEVDDAVAAADDESNSGSAAGGAGGGNGGVAAGDELSVPNLLERALRRLLDDSSALAAVEAKRAARQSRTTRAGVTAEAAFWQLIRGAASGALLRMVDAPDGAITTVLRESAASAERALFVGRVCRLFAHRSRALRDLFGDGSELHATLLRSLRTRMLAAHWQWIESVAVRLGRERFVAALRAEDASYESGGARRRANWQPVDGGDASVPLMPAQPSTAVFALLMAANGAVQRAGGHLVDAAVRRRLARRLARVALEALEPPSPSTKEASVQRLLDVRYLGDMLIGGSMRDAYDDDGTAAAAAALAGATIAPADIQWTDVQRALVSRIEAQLDPIDLAFYEPLVRSQAKRCYRRTAVLFGAFTQLAPLFTDDKTPLTSTTEQHNALVLAPTLPRFARLPVTVEDDDADENNDQQQQQQQQQQQVQGSAKLDANLQALYKEWAASSARASAASKTAPTPAATSATSTTKSKQPASDGILKNFFQF
jgi:hypothetical protein